MTGYYPLIIFDSSTFLLFQQLKSSQPLWAFKTGSLAIEDIIEGDFTSDFGFTSLTNRIDWRKSGHKLECPRSPATTVHDNSAYIFGGVDETFQPLDQLISITATPGTEEDGWPEFVIHLVSPRREHNPSMSSTRRRSNSTMHVFDNVLQIIGGLSIDKNYQMETKWPNSILLYDIESDCWSEEPCPGLPAISSCYSSASTSSDGKSLTITLIGGLNTKL